MKKLNQKKGISLIVLVITIAVMIILAAAIILSLSSSGIIGRANEARDKSDLSTLKELYTVKESEGILNGEAILEKEILQTVVEEMNLESDFDFSTALLYTGKNDDIKEWTLEKVALKKLAESGYIISVIDGEVYITGLDTEDDRAVTKMTALGYTVKDTNEEGLTTGNMTTGYTIYDSSEEKIATIVYFGDINSTGLVDSSDSLESQIYINNVNNTQEYNDIQIYAMDVDHDNVITPIDASEILKYYTGSGYIDQNSKIYRIKRADNYIVTPDQYAKYLGLTNHNVVEAEDEVMGTVYTITLNDDYTYVELRRKIREKSENPTIAYFDSEENEISTSSTEKISSNIYIDITLRGGYDGTTVYAATTFMLKVN